MDSARCIRTRARIILALALLFLLALGTFQAQAASFIYVRPGGDDVNCNGTADADYPGDGLGGCAVQTLQKGVDLVDAGGTVLVRSGTYVLTSVVNLNKAGITLEGDGPGNTILQVSGTGDRLGISAAGITLKDFEIIKTDKTGEQNIIRLVDGTNATILNNLIHGQFVIGDGEVSRAIVVNAGAFTGINIEGNTIYGLRQPAYISGTHTGFIQNNFVYRTKGWVVEGGNLTFLNNSWGSGAEVNVYDIAILSPVGAGPYPDIVAMSNANHEAVIEDQRVSPAVLSVAYVDASTAYTTDLGGRYHPYATISPAITRVVAGGTVHVAAGTYTAGANLNKPVTLLGAQAGIDARDGRPGALETVITAGGLGTFTLNATDVTFDGFKFTDIKGRTIDTYYDADRFTMRNCILQSPSIDPGYNTGAIQFGGGTTLHAHGLLFEQNLVTADYGQLFYMGHAMDQGTIRNNLFNGDSVSFGPFGERSGWVIEDNEFNGNVGTHGPYWGFGFNANLGDVVIRNNYVHHMQVGIGQITVVNGSITGNTFEDNAYAAFQLWGGEWGSVVSANALIANNWIEYNGVAYDNSTTYPAHGVRLRPGEGSVGPIDAATIHFQDNFFDNLGVGAAGSVWAIRQQGAGIADAEMNWWGTTDEATIAAMIGEGSADTTPWWTAFIHDPAKIGSYGFWPLPLCSSDCYVDAATGSDANQGTLDHPFLTIQKAVGSASSGGTVHVAAGTYVETGQIVIEKNLSIVGADKTTTIIKPAQDTGSSGDARAWWLVKPGFTFNLSKTTLDGQGKNIYQAIRSWGNGTIDDNDIQNIRYSKYLGMGVVVYGNMTVSNNTFTNIERLGVIAYGADCTHSVISGNTYTGKGAGDWLDYGIELGGGAQATIANNTITNNLGVAASDGSTSAGLLVTTYYGSGTTATITGNQITANTSGIAVGYDGSDTSTVVAHDNCISGNTAEGIFSTGPWVDAAGNWWGDATGPYHPTKNPSGLGNAAGDFVDFEPWVTDGCHGVATTGHWKNLRTNAFDDLAGALSAALSEDTIQGMCTDATPIPGGGTAAHDNLTIDLHGCTAGPGSPFLTVTGDNVTVFGPGILDGNGSSDPAILVNAGADNFILDGVQIKGWLDGVQVAGAVESLKIVNNWIHSNSDDALQVDALPSGIVTIEGNLFKANSGLGVEFAGSGSLDASYNSWGDDAGPAGVNGDGASPTVVVDPWSFAEFYLDLEDGTPGDQYLRTVSESTSFNVNLMGDAENLYGLSFLFTYDPTLLQLNSTTFAAPWSGTCLLMPATTSPVSNVCNLTSGPEWDGGVGVGSGAVIATFNFTATGSGLSGDGPWNNFFNLSHLTGETSAGAIGGVKVWINNAGYNAPSSSDRDITDANDGQLTINGIAAYTGFIDLQGRPNDSGALLKVFDDAGGTTLLAQASSLSSGKFTTTNESGKLLVIDSTYYLFVDRPLYLPTFTPYLSRALDTRSLTTLNNLLLLGGDATDDNLIDISDAGCIGGDYGLAPGVCGATGSSDVNGDGVINIYDLTLMGGNFTLSLSPWIP